MRTSAVCFGLVLVAASSSRLAGAAEAPPLAAAPDLAAAETAFTAALEAKKAGDAKAYRAGIERAARALPDPTRLLYRLAAARLGDGDRAGAIAALSLQADAAFARDPAADPEFAALAGDPAFVAVTARIRGAIEPRVASHAAFELPERDLLVEGIAFDAKTKAYFLSSVRQRKILRRADDGTWTTVAGFDGAKFGSPLGLVADSAARRLFAVTAGLPHGGADAALLGRGALVAIDLDSGRLVSSAGPFDAGRSANDLARAADGTIFLSDPEAKCIRRIAPDGTSIDLARIAGLRSPGGLALSADGERLYVADWSNGLGVVDLANGSFTWMRPPGASTLLGIDGLVRDGDALLAIQNGVPPARIQRLRLAADGRSIASAETLERAAPEWDEPTLGVVVDGELWYVAASQWPRYGEDGKPVGDPSTLLPATVRRLRLR